MRPKCDRRPEPSKPPCIPTNPFRVQLGSLFAALLALTGCRGDHGAEQLLVLGYTNGDTYTTALISLSPDTARVLREIPGIVVRRPSGALLLGVRTNCLDGGSEQVVWQTARLDQPVADSACADTPPDTTAAEREEDPARACADNKARIEFVSAGYVAIVTTVQQTEECEPRGGRWYTTASVRPLDGDQPLDLRDVWGTTAAAAWDSAAAAGFREMEKEGWNCPEPSRDTDTLSSWTIRHVSGTWRALAVANSSWGECEIFKEIERPLPDSIVGQPEPSVSFAEMAKILPVFSDYSVSADGGYVVITPPPDQPRGITIYGMKGGRLGRKLLELPMPVHRMIMTRWVSGDEAESWKRHGQ